MGSDPRAAVASLLVRVTGRTVRPYSTYEFGRGRDAACLSVVYPADGAKDVLPELRKGLPSGWLGFIGTSQWLGDEKHEGLVEIVVGPGASQFDILRLARSDAVNFDLETEDLIRKLQEWDKAVGIDILHAETDTVELSLLKSPADLDAFARDVYDFCPDIVDQGVETVEALRDAIAGSLEVYLWWD